MCALAAEPEGTAEAAEAETPAETKEEAAPSEDQLEAGAEDLASGTWSQAVRQALRYTRWTQTHVRMVSNRSGSSGHSGGGSGGGR